MNAIYKLILFLGLFPFVFTACDVIPLDGIEREKSTDTTQNVNPGLSTKRKILVEYFTGHGCVNCPSKSKAAFHELDTYGKNIVVMTIHAGFFAEYYMTADQLDLTSPSGNQISTDAGVTGVPTGRVNRADYKSTFLIYPTEWSTAASGFVDQESLVTIDIQITPLTADSVLKFKPTIQAVTAFDKQLNIESFLVEDSIIGNQKDGDVLIPDYVFMNVLRTEINSKSASKTLNTPTSVSAGALFSKEYEFNWTGKKWKAKQCSIIVVVSDALTGECIQTEKMKVIK